MSSSSRCGAVEEDGSKRDEDGDARRRADVEAPKRAEGAKDIEDVQETNEGYFS